MRRSHGGMTEMTGSRILAGLAALGGSLTLAFTGVASASTAATAGTAGTAATAATAATAGTAAAGSRDAASTRAFVRSSIRYDVVSLQRRHAIAAAAGAYVRGVSSGCGRGLAGVPVLRGSAQQTAVLELELESSLALEVRAFAPIRGLTDGVGRVQERLRFSDSVLQWLVHSDAAATSALLAMRVPDLCADVRALRSSHYTSLTPAGRRFVDDGSQILHAASASPSALAARMRRFAPAPVAAGVKRLSALRLRLAATESLQPHQAALLRTLFGGPPPSGL